MRDINIVLPIKDPTNAKERLASLLSAEQRRALAWLLIERTLAFFKDFTATANILVVTDSDRVAGRSEEEGYSVLREGRAEGETAAVERATRWSVEHGFRSQVVIPGDMAELDADEIRHLLTQDRPDPSVILCPATGDDGTNAILTTPPDVLRFRFGARSFPDYVEQARVKGVPCSVVRLDSLVLDLDTPDDVHAVLRNGRNASLKKVLEEWDIPRKL
jgi:2-phospho-L-lactate/phosphoenolpyruvate guanylyltransferase